MAAEVLETLSDGSVLFDCPGCGYAHRIAIGAGPAPRWEWNGDKAKPTFSPSIHVTWREKGEPRVCHCYVRDGRIEFLSDCTHSLASQTVPLNTVED